MIPGYESIIMPVLGKDGKKEDYYVNKCNINYFRPYGPDEKRDITSSDAEFKAPKTAMFMHGSSNLLQIALSPSDVENMLSEERVSLAGLDAEQRDLIKRMIEFYQKERMDKLKKGAN